ncbi:hypothetical protein K0M31_007633 [Melipona bicolor]|uniref:Uncharacterized protein n=1 Tax=Melipona bicolor TaxID=60889 RepID=A0AA40KVU3_9HYME|nr:hypothetical protein K0M31_007633 [Melipona bicolor]
MFNRKKIKHINHILNASTSRFSKLKKPSSSFSTTNETGGKTKNKEEGKRRAMANARRNVSRKMAGARNGEEEAAGVIAKAA